jgi:3-oxosteroid 1-dehydrogenase
VAAWNDEFDFVCIGSGAGGLASAVAAHDQGLSVAVFEKSARVGGTTVWSYGIVWLGNSLQAREAAIEDSDTATRAYLDYLGGGRNDPDVTGSFVANAPAAICYFAASANVPFYLVRGLPDHYYPYGAGSLSEGRSLQVRPFEARTLGDDRVRLQLTPYGHGRVTFEEMAAWGGRAGYREWDPEVIAEREKRDVRTFGGALAGYLFKAALDRNIPVRTDAPVSRLIVKNGRACGVEVMRDAQAIRIKARRGVMLATGLYDANRRLIGWFDEFDPTPPVGAAHNQGDGLVIALEQGSAFCVSHWNLNTKLSYHAEGERVDDQPFLRVAGSRELAYPHSFIVNQSGRRFADESSFGDVATKLRHFDFRTHRLINVPCWLIFDSQYLEKYGLPPIPPGADAPEWLPRGDTVCKLAERICVDAAQLKETIERFNGFVRSGKDTDFHRGEMPWARQAASDLKQNNPNLGLVSRPPYFALKVQPSQGSAVGLVTDGTGRVIHLRGQPIPGLYACGEVASWRHVGIGYQAGLSLAGAVTFGWLAAKHAASQTAV